MNVSTSVHDQTGYSTFAIENENLCQKCGRRHGSRKRSELQVQNIPERRAQSEQRRCRHGRPLRCRRHYHHEQRRLFPTDLPRPIVTQSNSNHLSHQSHREILVDQLIQVKQVDRRACTSHQRRHDSNGKLNTTFQSELHRKEDVHYQTSVYKRQNDQHRTISHKLSGSKSGRDYPEPIQTPMYDDETIRDTIGTSNELQRAQQSVYLRENINNSAYRELHFATKYIVLKRLEEKNNLINHNRFKVDHCFRPLKLQYQLLSTLHQDVPVISFTLTEQDRCQTESVVKTPYTRCPAVRDSYSSVHKLAFQDNLYSSDVLDRRSSPTSKQSTDPSSTNNMNTSAVATESIPSTTNGDTFISDTIVKRDFQETLIVEQKELTPNIDKKIDPFDLPISMPSYSRQQSRNASSHVLHQNVHRPSKDKRRDCRNETTVTVDVVKCRDSQQCPKRRNQPTHPRTENARNGHAARTAWSMPILVPPAHVPYPMGYFQPYSPCLDLYQEPTMLMENYPLPWSPNLDYGFRQQTSSDSHMDLPMCNGLPSDGPSPIWINDHDVCVPDGNRNFPEMQMHDDTTKTTVTTTNETTVSSSNSDNENNPSSTTTLAGRAQLVDKVKQILNALQTSLLNYKEKLSTRQEPHPIATSLPLPIQPPIYHMTIPSSLNANETPIRSEFINRLKKETNSSTMTSDSLLSNTSIQTTYSVSSTLPTMSKKKKTWELFGNRQRIFPSSSFLSGTTVDVENEIQRIDSDHHYRHRKHMKTQLRNRAKNVNGNQQISDGFDGSADNCLPLLASSTTKKSHLRRKKPCSRHMSPSFMFVLQLLLLFSLINRFLLSHLFGTISSDFLSPAVTINSQSVTRPASPSIDATNNKVFFSFFQD